jgi:TM2 domain-containing membrane protein YozV
MHQVEDASAAIGEPIRTRRRIALQTEVLKTMRDPALAGILSFLIPGVGQLYNGRILAGILWLILTPGMWIGTGGTLGWVCHVIAAWTAYSYAKDHPVRVY